MFRSLFINGQDCSALNSLNIFHRLEFGKKLSDSIMNLNDFQNEKNSIFIFKDSLKEKSYFNLFRFEKDYEEFSNLCLTLTSDKKLQKYYLWEVLNSDDLENVKLKKLPLKFSELLRRSIYLFGDFSEHKSELADFGIWKTDSYFWTCSKMQFILTLTYGSNQPEFNSVSITINDLEIEKIEHLNKLHY